MKPAANLVWLIENLLKGTRSYVARGKRGVTSIKEPKPLPQALRVRGRVFADALSHYAPTPANGDLRWLLLTFPIVRYSTAFGTAS